jgi:anthranilate/para-aminobenzoate synthase component I
VVIGPEAFSDRHRRAPTVTAILQGFGHRRRPSGLHPGTLTAVPRRALPRWIEPEAAYRALDPEHPGIVWSDRSRDAASPVSFLGVARDDADLLVLTGAVAPVEVAPRLRERQGGHHDPHLGWWGWFGYEGGEVALGLDPHAAESPAAAFLFAGRGLLFDHAAGTVTAVALDDDFRWLAPLGRAVAAARPVRGGRAGWRHGRAAYLERIAACTDAIRRGDAYLLCLTNQLHVDLAGRPDAVAVYTRLRSASATRFGGIVRIDAWTLVSGTPEQFLRIDRDGRATTSPIKGTRRRGGSPAEDLALAEELRMSEKERAENLMIVDLMRNDLSRVSAVGSVEVTRLFDVETYPTVHQLVSTVQADLAVDGLDAVVALFPAGSMTGAPKRSAMQLLHDLEGGPRGIYSGAWGRIGADGTVDLAVVIRSAVLGPDGATVGTGGGITILSDPDEEWREIETKASAVLAALGSEPPR